MLQHRRERKKKMIFHTAKQMPRRRHAVKARAMCGKFVVRRINTDGSSPNTHTNCPPPHSFLTANPRTRPIITQQTLRRLSALRTCRKQAGLTAAGLCCYFMSYTEERGGGGALIMCMFWTADMFLLGIKWRHENFIGTGGKKFFLFSLLFD